MERVSRREAMGLLAGGAAALVAGEAVAQTETTPAALPPGPPLKGRIKQAACKWCYGSIPLDEFAKQCAAMGIKGVDLLGPDEWPVVKKYGLICSMAWGPSGIPDGWNRPADHDRLVKESERLLPIISAAGLPNMIVFSGNRRGLNDSEGMDNCVTGLKRITKLAEDLKVNLVMELLNSKRDHKDYQCDHTAWGVELCKRVGSPRMKLLYDIYHMQIMEGDVIATLQESIGYIAHIHTGGVPGRNEIDGTQELNYARISKAIADAKFDGYMAHEFIPKRDPLTSLRQAVRLCDV
ncbi:MAG TPA: TIM barrel protein [Armatimonadota bacterium]|jgi:hydroxypyruvate isomerase